MATKIDQNIIKQKLVTFQEKKTFYTEILHGRKCYKSPQETRTCISAGK